MLMVLLLLSVGREVGESKAFGTARLIFIIPEKKEAISLYECEGEEILMENEEEGKIEDVLTIKIFTSNGVIELKDENNKEEIWKFIEEIKKGEHLAEK